MKAEPGVYGQRKVSKRYSNTNLDIVWLGIGACTSPNLHIGNKREWADWLIANILMGQILLMLLLMRKRNRYQLTGRFQKSPFISRNPLHPAAGPRISSLLLNPDRNFHQVAPNHSRDGFSSSSQTAGKWEVATGHRALTNLGRKQPLIICNCILKANFLDDGRIYFS